MVRKEVTPAKYRYPTREKRSSAEACGLFDEGEDLWFGVTTGSPDLAGAVAKYKLAAELEHAGAQNYLGLAYRHGSGVERNEVEAVRLYMKAARAGNAEGQNNLGACYSLGISVKRDHVHAYHLYKYAEQAGTCMAAKNNLGRCLQRGLGCEKDPSLAFALFKEAADAGIHAAQSNLGICYELGKGTPKDPKKAVQLYSAAAAAGSVAAMFNLAVSYEEGVGVDASDVQGNKDKALYWMERAAGKGDKNAIEALKDMKEYDALLKIQQQQEKASANSPIQPNQAAPVLVD